MSTSENNKRIAKNTILLYIRMLFMMLISLYTSRVILNTLGVEDFGIYNVVGGVVAMFSILSSSLSSAISRYITFELGKEDKTRLKQVFSASVTIQLVLSAIIVVLIETVGVWFLNCKMNIPHGRLFAANWLLQFSIINFVINLISVPYNATIIAHEKMSAFAYISIYEGLGKLAVAFLIGIAPFDRLIFYGLLLCVIAASVRFIYGYYCKKHFEECEYHFRWDKALLKNMFGFAGWNFIGSSAGILRNQGVNILLNLYFGPIVNAAGGVANQVNNAVAGFSNNFMTAVNPQIIKLYSKGELKESFKLVFNSSRLSFMLMVVLTTPLIIEAPFILKIWLKTVPEYSVDFARLILLLTLAECTCIPLVTLNQATGNIRNYQLVAGGIHMLNFPFSWLALKFGSQPQIVYVIAIGLAIINLYARLIMLNRSLRLSVKDFTVQTVLPCLLVVAVVYGFCFISMKLVLNHFVNLAIVVVISSAVVFLLGLKSNERNFILKKIRHNEK